jgi:hypothetical protein
VVAEVAASLMSLILALVRRAVLAPLAVRQVDRHADRSAAAER